MKLRDKARTKITLPIVDHKVTVTETGYEVFLKTEKEFHVLEYNNILDFIQDVAPYMNKVEKMEK